MSVAFVVLLSWLPDAHAHSPIAQEQADPAVTFSAVMLLLFWLAYLWGARKVRPPASSQICFHVATALTAVTIFGPLDEWAETNTAAHMAQHMLMMVAIAPLWVMARPLPQWAALHSSVVSTLFAPLMQCVRYPMLAASIHAAVIWFWHAPKLYVLALEQPWWHVFEHFCFLLTAGVFWWAVLRSQKTAAPRALLALLFTLMHTGFLGALLTFAPNSLYGPGRQLADQQLAGLLMWVLGGIPYLTAAWWIGWRWFQRVLRPAPAT